MEKDYLKLREFCREALNQLVHSHMGEDVNWEKLDNLSNTSEDIKKLYNYVLDSYE